MHVLIQLFAAVHNKPLLLLLLLLSYFPNAGRQAVKCLQCNRTRLSSPVAGLTCRLCW